MFISVVLPAPFSPRSARISPRCRERSMASLATSAPKRFVTPASERMTGAPDAAAARPAARVRPGSIGSARLRLRVVHVDAEVAFDDILLLVPRELHHVRGDELVVDGEA